MLSEFRIDKPMQIIRKITVMSSLTVLVIVLMRVFLFASFSIPTVSMQPTLIPGDYILVNKLILGARLDWPFTSVDMDKCCSTRINGFRGIKRQDILVFNTPYYQLNKIEKNPNTFYIKRCIGIPGDTLNIVDGIYWIKSNLGTFRASRSWSKMLQAVGLKDYSSDMFKSLHWTLSQFGPLYIPKVGDEIVLDSINIHFYQNIIEYETNKKMHYSKGNFFLEHEPFLKYKFQQNYYFVGGDNAVDSEDSRFWGLLPEDHIVGKAAFIWKSINPITKEYRFKRFLKSLDLQ
jgi:signal peptidase I